MNELILLLLAVPAIHYFIFLINIYRGLKKIAHNSDIKIPDDFISVIIPFRNESENILLNLESIENQDYPKSKYEVIYVNDNSDDDSPAKLCTQKKSENIKIFKVDNSSAEKAHKKRTVAFGIEKASGEIIVTTDADCLYHNNWLKNIAGQFCADTGLVSGAVDFYSSDLLLNKIQRLEFQGLILAGAGLIGINKPVICSAANLAFRKKVFIEVDGYNDTLHLSSGDDELLMQKIWRTGKYKIKFCAEPDAIVRTEFNKSFNQFFNQRTRWASKGLFYTDKILILQLILIYFYYLTLAALFILSFFSLLYFIFFISSVAVKILLEYLILKKGNDLIFKSTMIKYLLPAELMQIPYIIFVGISGALGFFKWKGRRLKR